jgi:hypothetical protein
MLRRFQLAAFVLALTLGFGVFATAETLEPVVPVAEDAVCALDAVFAEASPVSEFEGSACENECYQSFRACYNYCEPRGCLSTCWDQWSRCVQVCP